MNIHTLSNILIPALIVVGFFSLNYFINKHIIRASAEQKGWVVNKISFDGFGPVWGSNNGGFINNRKGSIGTITQFYKVEYADPMGNRRRKICKIVGLIGTVDWDV